MNKAAVLILFISLAMSGCGDDPAHEEGLTITTLAGYADDAPGSKDGAGAVARFAYPSGITVDTDGNLYVTDSNIRKITPDGVVTTLVVKVVAEPVQLSGLTDISCDNDGNLYVSDANYERAYRIDQGGQAQYVDIPAAGAIVVDDSGNVFVGTLSNIVKISPNGDMQSYAGSGSQGFADGDLSTARFGAITGLDIDSDGNLYVADRGNKRIRKVTSTGVTTIAVSGADSEFINLSGIGVDPGGNIYVGDQLTKQDLTQTTLISVVKRITPGGSVQIVAGGEYGFADGHGSKAQFRGISDVVVDRNGVVYIVDAAANTIRKGIFE